VTAFIPYKIYQEKKVLKILLVTVIALLALVLVFGHTAGNATSWLVLGPIVEKVDEQFFNNIKDTQEDFNEMLHALL